MEAAELIEAIRAMPHIPLSIDMWSKHEIAAILKKSPRTVAERYACKPDFPRPYKLSTGDLRWKASEIMEWIEKQRV